MSRTLLVALPLLFLAGCQSKPSVVGKWTVPVEGLGTVDASFDANKSMSLKGSVMGYGVSIAGTYEPGENQLTVEPKDVTIQGEIPALFKDAAQKEIDKLKDKPVTFKATWQGADTLVLEPLPGTPAGALNQTLTLTRVMNQGSSSPSAQSSRAQPQPKSSPGKPETP